MTEGSFLNHEVMTVGSITVLNNPYFVKLGLIGLFINSLLSSVIPIPTELTTSGLLLEGQSKTSIFIILVSGSILGGFIAYYIGYGGIGFLKRLRKKPSKKSEDKSTSLLKKYGWTILFISPWIPIIGDYIPIVAGATNYNFRLFTIAIISGKIVKGIAIVFFGSLILPLIFPSGLFTLDLRLGIYSVNVSHTLVSFYGALQKPEIVQTETRNSFVSQLPTNLSIVSQYQSAIVRNCLLYKQLYRHSMPCRLEDILAPPNYSLCY